MKIVFVANNKNKRLARVLPKLEKRFRDLGEVQVLSTLRKKHAIDLARGASENGCDYLIAVGGDGTLHEVLNGLMQSNLPTNAYPAIGLLPYGSANDFARTANSSKSIDTLVDLIRTKNIRKVDLAKIILHETGEIRYFINVAGVGLGAEVAQNLAASSSALGPGFHYFIHILKGFLKYSKKHVSCTGNTWQWKGPLLQLAV
ncbi:MAG: diacylglycerol kinase family protein, partial [Robiginitalea sp.]|nr:diacylglycerol kinase family protein [Robiginitalea sp.]